MDYLNYVDDIIIGEFEADNSFMNENRIGNFSGYTVHVYGGEGTIPHFHVISKNESFHTCVCIFEPMYFLHPGKTSKFSNTEKKDLDKFMRATNPKDTKYSNWETCVRLWVLLNDMPAMSKRKGYKDISEILQKEKQPDYTIINDSFHK